MNNNCCESGTPCLMADILAPMESLANSQMNELKGLSGLVKQAKRRYRASKQEFQQILTANEQTRRLLAAKAINTMWLLVVLVMGIAIGFGVIGNATYRQGYFKEYTK